MTDTAPRFERKMYGLTFRKVEVVSVDRLKPNYARIVFGGPDLAGFESGDPHDHFKMLFPENNAMEPVLPTRGEKGFVYPDDAPAQALRDFTPRHVDPAANQLTVDFVLHESGPASNWAKQAAPGHEVGMVGPRGSKIVSYDFDWYLMIGDETVWPSIARRLEEAPAGATFLAFVEVDDAAGGHPFETQADADVRWVHRNGAPAGSGTALEDAIRAAEFPEGEFYVWAGGEATSLKPIRRHLLNERGARREYANFSGHWKRGVADHDHHEPVDPEDAG